MSEQSQRAKEIFVDLIGSVPPEQWEDRLELAVGGNERLRDRVRALLQAHADPGSLLQEPAPLMNIATGEPIDLEPIGSTIGPYTLREQIAEGGMGLVYVAEQTLPFARKVALKVIKPGMDTRQVIARFEAERQALAMMDHPNVAKVLDAGSTDSGRPYFVMDLVRGLPITEYCDKQKLSPHERLELFVTVCDAVQHAHRKGIIHRDIKPNNVMVTRNGDRAVPKVIDFGVAKAINQRLTERTIYTQLNQLIGTPLYMSPEQAEMSELDIDTRTDVYSLGILLYELLTGSTPLDKEKLSSVGYDELRRMVKEEEPPRPSDRVSTLDMNRLSTISQQRSSAPQKLSHTIRGELDWIVMKAIEKDRRRRYESASAFAADVQRFLTGEAVEACPPSTGYRFRKFARRNKTAMTTGGVVLLATVLGIIGTSWQAWRATRALATAEHNLQLAGEERQRAEGNLQLAMQAVDEAYLASIEDRLLVVTIDTLGWDWRGEELLRANVSTKPEFTQQEQDLMRRGLSFYDQIARQNPSSQQALFQSALAFSKTGLLRAGLDEKEQAQQAYDEAISRFRRLSDRDPTRAKYFVELARVFFQRSQLNAWESETLRAAVSVASRAIELNPDNADAHRLRGMAYYELKQYESALPDFEEVIKQQPDAAAGQLYLSKVFALLEEHDLSLQHAEQAIELAPDVARYWHHRGLTYLELGKAENAVRDFSQAIELAPGGAAYWSMRGVAHELAGRFEEALQDFSQAIKLDPGNTKYWGHRGQVQRDLGQWKQAIEDYSRAIELDPDVVYWAWASRGLSFDKLGQHEKAWEDFSVAIRLQPNAAELWDSRGLVLGHLGRWEEALADFTKAESLAEGSDLQDQSLQNRCYALRSLGRWEEAVAGHEQGIELFPDSAKGFDGFAWLLATWPQPERRDPERAVRLAQKAVELAPNRRISWVTLGVAAYRLGDYQQATMALDKSLQLGFRSSIANYQTVAELFLAMTHWQLGQRDDARTFYDRAVRGIQARNAKSEAIREALAEAKELLNLSDTRTAEEYYGHQGNVQEDLGHWTKAVDDYSRAIELDPEVGYWVWASRAFVLDKLGQREQAWEDYSVAIQLQPEMAELWNARGRVALRLDRLEEALADFTKAESLALSADPYQVDYLQNRCYALRRLGRWEEALAGHEEGIDRFPDSADAFDGFAWMLATWPEPDKRDPDRAVRLAQKAVELAPTRVISWVRLGVAAYRLGDLEQAIEALEKSLELGFGTSLANYQTVAELFLAMTHWQLGQRDDAQAFYDRAVRGIQARNAKSEAIREALAEAKELLNLSDTRTAEEEEP